MPDINESQTREQLIDQALGRAGWEVSNPNQVGIELPVDGTDAQRACRLRERRAAGEDVQPPSGFADYVLYRETGEVLPVAQAKRLHEGTTRL